MPFRDLKATAEERRQALPGDDLVRDAAVTIMNAVTIAAPPARVWPWLVQMGSGRGGWYSYDFVDNDGHPSARTIVSSLQHITPGDVLPSLPGTRDSFVVVRVVPELDLILTVPSADGGVGVSWEFFLKPIETWTRLLVRGRVSAGWPTGMRASPTSHGLRPIEFVYRVLGKIPRGVMMPIALFGHGLMQARQLRGIKRRSEGTLRGQRRAEDSPTGSRPFAVRRR